MSRFTLTAALVSAALVAAPALAQSTPAGVQAATALVDMLNPPAQAKAQLEAQLKNTRTGNQLRQMLSQDPKFREAEAKNKAQFSATFARIGAMQADTLGPIQREMLTAGRQTAIATYAATFTPAELNAITAFFKTAAGAKFLAKQGAVNVQVGKSNQAKFAPRIAAAEKALAPKVQAELKKLAPASAPAK